MQYDFLNIRATFTENEEDNTSGLLVMNLLKDGEIGSQVHSTQIFNFNQTEEELKQLIINAIYPVPAVQPPEGSPERIYGSATQYIPQRVFAYPEIGDQLDMIYKDMQSGGTSFVDTIKNIKDSIPKPEDIQRPPEGMSTAYKQERLDVWNEMYGFNLSMEEFYGSQIL